MKSIAKRGVHCQSKSQKSVDTKGLSINDVRFFGLFFDLPTPVRFYPNIDFQFFYMVSDFGTAKKK